MGSMKGWIKMEQLLDATIILDAELTPEQLDEVIHSLKDNSERLLNELELMREKKKVIWGY